jgi:hypothetical protein
VIDGEPISLWFERLVRITGDMDGSSATIGRATGTVMQGPARDDARHDGRARRVLHLRTESDGSYVGLCHLTHPVGPAPATTNMAQDQRQIIIEPLTLTAPRSSPANFLDDLTLPDSLRGGCWAGLWTVHGVDRLLSYVS